MKKQTLLAILIAAVLLLSGCSLNTVDTVADKAQTILSVDGRTLDKGTVATYVSNMQEYYEQQRQMYEAYGLGQYFNQDTSASGILTELISSYTDDFVLLNKAEELLKENKIELTEEDLAHINETAQANYDSMIDSVAQNVITSGATGDQLRQEAIAYAESHGMTTLDEYVRMARESELVEKIEAYTKKDVTVEDADIQAKLDEMVASAKTTYESDPAAYGTAVGNGTAVYYAPAGYRYVKHILINFSEEDAAAVSEASTARAAAQTELDSANAKLTEAEAALNGAAEDADKGPLQTAVEEAKAAVETATEALNTAAAAYDAAKAAAAANIQAKADEVYALVKAEGADFDALMAEYGEDPGMKTDPAKTNGYAVCASTSFVEEFLNAALALEKVGDISEEVVSSYGIHIIKYEAEIPEGPISLEAARDLLTETVKTAKETEAYQKALDEWKAAAKIEAHPEKMGY